MKRLIAVLVLAVVGLGFVSTAALARAPSGAIFTTLEDGTQVNANIYEFAEDVYLDGGPGPNAPSDAAGLPEGIYIFQVTDPSGKLLLSTDDFVCRAFYVDERGVIADVMPAGGCEHATGTDADHDATTVQLMPFLETPNPGGEYKVWVTPIEAFDPLGETKYHGFVSSASKTDMFKVLTPPGPPDDID